MIIFAVLSGSEFNWKTSTVCDPNPRFSLFGEYM